ncbi:DNA-binding protein [uncultured Herbaspirillum sp.]|uniref:DNA-binding protein n=1 Tax=uncultured Herbaspirillum sp. TaxID=160236 RepID=UPI00261C2EA1|nr:DNA-binding protein [uncultured Herbaspirillum sp.]
MKAKKTMSGDEVREDFRRRGITLASWATANGFRYATVSGVVRGVLKGNFGEAHEVAVALRMKEQTPGKEAA